MAVEHPSLLGLGNQSQPNKVALEDLKALSGQAHLRGDHVEAHRAFALPENLEVALLDGIEAQAVDLLDAAHPLHMGRRDVVGFLRRRLPLRRVQEADGEPGGATAFRGELHNRPVVDGPAHPPGPLPDQLSDLVVRVVRQAQVDAEPLPHTAGEKVFVGGSPDQQNGGNVTTCFLPRNSFRSSRAR